VGLIATAFFVLFAVQIYADTWQLSNDSQLKPAQQQDEFAQAVSQIKQLSAEGKPEELEKAFGELKKNFPQIAGPELDAFIDAEMLFCIGKYEASYRSFEKLLNRFTDGKFYDAAIERQFAIGTAFLQGRKKKVLKVFKIGGYDEGRNIMEKIADRAGDAPIAQQALVTIAVSYEERKRFEEAYQQWSIISSRWPVGEIAKDALLAMARCKHASYRGPGFDNSSLTSAKSYYERFKAVYPEDAARLEIDNRLALIEEQLAYKKFEIGHYYQRIGAEPADANFAGPAELYYQIVLQDWPNSTAAKMATAAMTGQEIVADKVKK
jgi:outer membrane protein assembly factor BamD (BamD/ComL family)